MPPPRASNHRASPPREFRGVRRFAAAVVLSGVPSTVHALVTGGDPLRATKAAGSLARFAGAGVVERSATVGLLARFGGAGVVERSRTIGLLARFGGAGVMERSGTIGLVARGVAVHVVVSAWWAFVLTRLRVRGVAGGVVAGLLIAALDLEVIGRRWPEIRALPRGSQWLDHVAFGVLVTARSRKEA